MIRHLVRSRFGFAAFTAKAEMGEFKMLKKITATALIGTALVLSACNTVRGAGEDVTSVANCTEELMKQGKC